VKLNGTPCFTEQKKADLEGHTTRKEGGQGAIRRGPERG